MNSKMPLGDKLDIVFIYMKNHITNEANAEAHVVDIHHYPEGINIKLETGPYMDRPPVTLEYFIDRNALKRCHPEFLPMFGINAGAQYMSEYEKYMKSEGFL